MSIVNPRFILDYNSSILQCNYLYCEEFGRYYFINNVSFESAHRMVLNCHVDVLYTYRNEINNLDALVSRQEIEKNSKIADDQIPWEGNYQYKLYTTSLQPLADTTGNNVVQYVVQTLGGYNNNAQAYVPIYSEPTDWSTNWTTYYVYDAQGIMTSLGDMYPGVSTAIAFTTIQGTWGQVYRKTS